MSLIDVDSWITECEACERLSQNILSEIVKRDQHNRLSEDYSKISAGVRIRLKQFSTELKELKIKLDGSSKSGITIEELERRERQIECLQSKLLTLENKFKSTRRSERDDLLYLKTSSLWENDDEDEPMIGGPSQKVEVLRQHQIQTLEDQNKGLEVLSQTISRQKNLASRLGEEVEEQNEILDVLTDTMERTDVRINSETKHVGIVSQQDKTWGYWVLIIVLFLAICLVGLLL